MSCREITETEPNIASGTAKTDQDTNDAGILQYAYHVREIPNISILCVGTRKPILIIQANPTLIDR